MHRIPDEFHLFETTTFEFLNYPHTDFDKSVYTRQIGYVA